MPIITLLTDFGGASPYPAQVKAVLLSACRATIVDITHDVPAHDIAQGAYLLLAAAPTFPAGTVHLAVVDPGVGTGRQPLAVASGGHLFVGPDNGLLVPAARALGTPSARVIDVHRFGRHPVAPTFHGRDLFAPAAAALAAGLPIEALGPPSAALVELPEPPPVRAAGALSGSIRYRDPFGNLVTNLPGSWLDELAGPLVMESPSGRGRPRRIQVRRVRTYAEGAPREPVVLVGSDGMVEIALAQGRAAERLRLAVGDPIVLRAAPSPGGRRRAGGRTVA